MGPGGSNQGGAQSDLCTLWEGGDHTATAWRTAMKWDSPIFQVTPQQCAEIAAFVNDPAWKRSLLAVQVATSKVLETDALTGGTREVCCMVRLQGLG